MSRNRGFGAVEGLIGVVVIVVVGAAGYYMWSQRDDDESQNNSSQVQQQGEVAENEQNNFENEQPLPVGSGNTIVNADLGYTLAVPDGWTAVQKTADHLDFAIVELRSGDFAASETDQGFSAGAPSAGAVITITAYPSSGTQLSAQEFLSSADTSPVVHNGVAKAITVDGVAGYQYLLGNDGHPSYWVVVHSDSVTYNMNVSKPVSSTDTDDLVAHYSDVIDEFDAVIASFKFTP